MEVSAATEQKSLLATLAPGKRTRLRRLLFEFGPGNGTLLLLPIDQGIEHGPRDFFPNPASKDPEYQFQLAAEAGYSAIACQIGLAEKYYPDYAGQVPLLLKVNGKTDIPPSDEALSTTQRARSRTRCASAPTRSATRSTSARRARTRTSHQLNGRCARTATATGCRWSIWAYPRGSASSQEGRPELASTRSTTPPGWRWRWAPTWSSSTCRSRPEPHKDSPAPYNELEVSQEEAVQPGGRLGRALAGRALGRLEDRRRPPARPDPLHHGGGRLGRDLRPQRLAARVVGGARDRSSRSRRSCSPRSAGSPSRCPSAYPASARSPCWRSWSSSCVSNSGGEDGDGSSAGRGPQGPANGIEVPVADVVDGDTIEVLVNGHEEDVRYIGVDTPGVGRPRPAGRVLRPRRRAASTNASSTARRVRLEFDAERRDVYGRLLAYVYVGRPVRQRRAGPRGLRDAR